MLTRVQAQITTSGKFKTSIAGKVVDSVNKISLEYATITLFTEEGKKELDGTTTDKKGHFKLKKIPEGYYRIVVDFIGYQSHTINHIVISRDSGDINLKDIELSRKIVPLQLVTVTAQEKLISNRIDKIVFNAENDLTSQTGVATDLLKKIPQVTVDINGNVQLLGTSGVRFLINGKPSSVFGSHIADVLQSIPASQIKSIEVITNPGAKYEAQGMGGIINIILKKNGAQGVNGNLSVTAGTRNENGSFNFNARHGKIGINAFISGNARLTVPTPMSSERISYDSAQRTNILLNQQGVNDLQRQGFQSGISFDWTYKEKNNFTGSLNFNHFGNKINGFLNKEEIVKDPNDSILSITNNINYTDSRFRFHNVDASIGYKRTFDKEDQELEISLTTSTGNNYSYAGGYQLLLPRDSMIYGTTNTNPGKEREIEIQIDYNQPLKKDIQLGLGGKISFRDINSGSDITTWQPRVQQYIFNPFLSNYLNYHQKVYAFYTELSFPVGELFETKIGGRYERTQIDAFYSNAQQQASIPGYNTFVPSIFISKKIREKYTLKFSYSRRIERPDFEDLNPYINISDPNNVSSGNPYLKPEIGTRYELGYYRDFGKEGSCMVNFFYHSSDQDIQSYIVYYPTIKVGDTTYSNVAVSKAQNIGLEKSIGVNIYGDLHLNTKLNIRTNLFFFYIRTSNIYDPAIHSASFNYRFNLNASYQLSKTLAAEFFGNFNSPEQELQGRSPGFVTYSFAIRRQFWNKKGSLALTAINPFNEYLDQKTYLHGPNFSLNTIQKIPYRSIALNFTWKFGYSESKNNKEEIDEPVSPKKQRF